MRPAEHDQRTGLIGRRSAAGAVGRAGSRDATDRAFAAALTILAGLGAVAVAHRLSGGSVLPSRGLTLALLLAGAGAFAWSWRGRWPRGAAEPGAAGYWGPVALGGVLLVLATWWGDPGGLRLSAAMKEAAITNPIPKNWIRANTTCWRAKLAADTAVS